MTRMILAVAGLWLVAFGLDLIALLAPSRVAEAVSVTTMLTAAAATWLLLQLQGSLPRLDGLIVIEGQLGDPATIRRDRSGVPTIIGRSRGDVAWATGFAHGQERFFQMDLQRRAAAGEVAALFGRTGLDHDRSVATHRFRDRAHAALARLRPEDRALLDAYTEGVNTGLRSLRARPFEYLLLRARPATWHPADCLLTIFGMYLALQDGEGQTKRYRIDVERALGRAMADFLFPEGTDCDAALDGSFLPSAAIPTTHMEGRFASSTTGAMTEAGTPGSNCFAVGGALTAHGAAILANDMHLALRVPNIFYRVRLRVCDPDAPLDVAGVTLPGMPNVVTGSNGRVAWGFSNACVDTVDLIALRSASDDRSDYLTADGPLPTECCTRQIAIKGAPPATHTHEESVWGPIVAGGRGQRLAVRWAAYHPRAVDVHALFALERATTVDTTLDLAPSLGIPHQNLVVADRDGAVGWAVTGPLPCRYPSRVSPLCSTSMSRDWIDIDPARRPRVQSPETHRLWTANARTIGGDGLAVLGFGAYAHGGRAGQIRDALFARDQFTEGDLFAVQLDDHARLLERWRTLLHDLLGARLPKAAPHREAIEAWDGHAETSSIGYRLVRTFRSETIGTIYRAFLGDLWTVSTPGVSPVRPLTHHIDEPAWRLLEAMPDHLVPPGFASWNALVDGVVDGLLAQAGSPRALRRFTWGAVNRSGIRHPLSRAVPGLKWLVDMPDRPMRGDIFQPRVAAPGFGAATRSVVTPGRESDGIFQMPAGQSGHPLSPYYGAGHMNWFAATPTTPFLPGPPRWRLDLHPRRP